MKCPYCALVNPDSAARCDCGYGFVRAGPLRGHHRAGAGSGPAWVCIGLSLLCPIVLGFIFCSSWLPWGWGLGLGLTGAALGAIATALADERDPGTLVIGFIAMMVGVATVGWAAFAKGMSCE